MANTVYAVISVLNGYKNVEDIYAGKDDAYRRMRELSESSKYESHEIWVCSYELK